MANQYLEVDQERLIAFANGTAVGGYTVAAPGTNVIDTAPALEVVTNATNGWTLAAKVIVGAKEIYTLHHA